ncbi:hypothetical protein JH25_07635 [Pseudomonas sp. BRG-100]|uniref:DUF6338 family protein n=1 Tax=Pseudomonas sp. BRG-100 TaxID=1524267 RepID=UPI0004E60BC2|nr:DUF6338 family protein [Pseudomonas sp. BRG-100]KFF43648.1 hypothetical protein JH25_07635 [Pseudomonas sp. BRG-100]
MGEIAGTLMPILQALLPGFLAMVVFYWLADAKKPGQFEQVIQALICTGLIKILVDGIAVIAIWVGQWGTLGVWTENVATSWAVVLAIGFGLALAYFSRHDVLYKFARKVGLTAKASVGEWRYAFLRFPDRGVVLSLKDGRRLMGYPLAWPAEPESGHFVMEFPTWVVGDDLVPQDGVTYLLIANSDVQWVEFLEPQGDAK